MERKLRKLQKDVSATGDPIELKEIQALEAKINELLLTGNMLKFTFNSSMKL